MIYSFYHGRIHKNSLYFNQGFTFFPKSVTNLSSPSNVLFTRLNPWGTRRVSRNQLYGDFCFATDDVKIHLDLRRKKKNSKNRKTTDIFPHLWVANLKKMEWFISQKLISHISLWIYHAGNASRTTWSAKPYYCFWLIDAGLPNENQQWYKDHAEHCAKCQNFSLFVGSHESFGNISFPTKKTSNNCKSLTVRKCMLLLNRQHSMIKIVMLTQLIST